MSHVHDIGVKISWYMKVSETVPRKVRETERSNMTPRGMFSNLVSIIACLIFVCVGYASAVRTFLHGTVYDSSHKDCMSLLGFFFFN
jgi:hypothetical protein